MRLAPALALLALASTSACRKAEPAAPAPSTPATPAPAVTRDLSFKQEGTLAFRRDGAEIAAVKIEIADTDSTRERGLMERTPLADDQAMLFIFPTAGPQSFWMANTPSPLDIIYVGADSAVVSIAKYTKPFSTDPIPSAGPAQFVVEVRAGWADAKGLAPGDKMAFVRTDRPLA